MESSFSNFLTTLNIKNTFSYAYVTFSHPPWKCYSPENTDYSSLFSTQNINEKSANGSQYNVSEIYTSKSYDFKNLMTILTVLSNGIPFTEEKNQGSQESSFAQVGAGDDDCRNYICHSWGQCSLLNQRPHVQVILITEGLRASIRSPSAFHQFNAAASLPMEPSIYNSEKSFGSTLP